MKTLASLVFRIRDQWTGRKDLLSIRRKHRTESMSGGEVVSAVHSLALALEARGVQKGDRIALFAENCPEWHIIDLACQLLGAVSVPIYPNLPADQVAFIVKNSGSMWLFYRNARQRPVVDAVTEGVTGKLEVVSIEDDELDEPHGRSLTWLLGEGAARRAAQPLERFHDRATPLDLASIIYTSGTTGEPKGVALTHKNLVSNFLACAEIFAVGPEDRALSFLPLSHVFERTVDHLLLYSGCEIHYAPRIEHVPRLLPEIQPTLLSSVPRLYERAHIGVLKAARKETPGKQKAFQRALDTGRDYLEAKERGFVNPWLYLRHRIAERAVFRKVRERFGSRLRLPISGGAPLPATVEEFFEIVGMPIYQGYGLTETSPVLAANRPGASKRNAVGKPLAEVEIKIAKDREILVKSPGIMRGYWENDEATRAVIDDDNWFHTGDVGRQDSAGFVFITDRKKDLIVTSGGKNVAPQPLESSLSSHEMIDQAVVVGESYPYLAALIVPDLELFERRFGAATPEQVRATPNAIAAIDVVVEQLNATVARHEQIRKWTLLPEPLTVASGDLTPTLKVRRRLVMKKFDEVIRSLYPDSQGSPDLHPSQEAAELDKADETETTEEIEKTEETGQAEKRGQTEESGEPVEADDTVDDGELVEEDSPEDSEEGTEPEDQEQP